MDYELELKWNDQNTIEKQSNEYLPDVVAAGGHWIVPQKH